MNKYKVTFNECITVNAESEAEAIEMAIDQFDFGSINAYANNKEQYYVCFTRDNIYEM
jgi:hypothetical protein